MFIETIGSSKGYQVETNILDFNPSPPDQSETVWQSKGTQTEETKTSDARCGPDQRSCIFSGYDSAKRSEKVMQDLTGVRAAVFSLLLTLLPNEGRSTEVTKSNRLLIFMMKMKIGLTYSVLGSLFDISAKTASNIFTQVLFILYNQTMDWILWPTKYEIMQTMPECFRNKYPCCRGIIDCTEVKTQCPAGVEKQVKLWSNYKGGWTVKFLVCIAPSGLITFVSRAYGGRSSDAYITNSCGILEKFEPGDEIMADKGFPHIKVQHGITVVMPPFANKDRPQFTQEEMENTFSVASVRIHVERTIQRLKIFSILTNRLSVDLIPHTHHIIHVAAVLTNLSSPIIKK